MAALFSTGQIVATPGALSALVEAGANPVTLLDRHQAGDWGEVPAEDAAENTYALLHGFRIMSSYRLETGTRLWVLTEADRSLTTRLPKVVQERLGHSTIALTMDTYGHIVPTFHREAADRLHALLARHRQTP
jgi:hypothetical protein